MAMVFCLYGIFKSNLYLPWCFFAAFIFFGFLLLPSKLSGIVKPPLEVASTLQDHCLLTWYQSHLPVAMVFCLYGIFKSNLCLPWCFFCCIHLFWLPTVAVKTLRYSQATVRSRINTTRPLPSSNYCHRAKLHSRDLLNLIKSQDFIKLPS